MALDLLPPAALLPAEIQGQASGVPVTEAQLCQLLAGERVQIVRLVTRTLPKFRRGSPFAPRSIVRLCVRCGFIGADYLSVVRRQRIREGMDLSGAWARVAPGPLWRGNGRPVDGNRHLVCHVPSGLLYLVLYPQTDYRGVPIESFRAYFTTDAREPVDRTLVEAWRVRSLGGNFPRTQKKIPWRLPCLGSIVSITLGGTPYALIGERSVPLNAKPRQKRQPAKTKAALAETKAAVGETPAVAAETFARPEMSPELLAAIRAAKLGEPQPNWQAIVTRAVGPGAIGKLLETMNGLPAGASLLTVLPWGSHFVVLFR